MSWRIKLSAAMLSACAFGNAASAASLLHSLFNDHAVLQREQPINVWGEAQAGEKVEVMLGNARAQAIADSRGSWSVTLPAMSAGGPYTLSATASSGTRQDVRDVLVGDVWLCSGQSNMVIPVNRALDARSEIANASSDTVRLLTIPNASHALPQQHFAQPIAWQSVNSTTISEFSATCWFFARELQKTVEELRIAEEDLRASNDRLKAQIRERRQAEETLRLVMGQPDIYEYYHPLTGAPPPAGGLARHAISPSPNPARFNVRRQSADSSRNSCMPAIRRSSAIWLNC